MDSLTVTEPLNFTLKVKFKEDVNIFNGGTYCCQTMDLL